MYTFNKTEQEKLVDAATWNELEASPLDHLLLPTGQTAYCLSLCKSQSCGFVSQLTGCFVFYLKKNNSSCLCHSQEYSVADSFKVKSADMELLS